MASFVAFFEKINDVVRRLGRKDIFIKYVMYRFKAMLPAASLKNDEVKRDESGGISFLSIFSIIMLSS